MIKTGFKILIVGDVMLDEYIIGDHTRRSPEADVPVIHFKNREYRLGGAANVANNMKSMGLESHLVSIIGEDSAGSSIQEICTYSGIYAHLIVDSDRPTTKKTRIVDASFKQYLRLDEESTKAIGEGVFSALKIKIESLIKAEKFDAIIIQDYNKGCISKAVLAYLQSLSELHQLPMIVDPKHDHFVELSNGTIFKPNLNELSKAVGRKVLPEIADINSVVKQLNLNDQAYVFVSLADKGIFFKYKDEYGLIDGIEVSNADVSGAGDTVICALTLAYLNDFSVQKMARFANQCGAYVCAQMGIAQIPLSQIRKTAKSLDL